MIFQGNAKVKLGKKGMARTAHVNSLITDNAQYLHIYESVFAVNLQEKDVTGSITA